MTRILMMAAASTLALAGVAGAQMTNNTSTVKTSAHAPAGTMVKTHTTRTMRSKASEERAEATKRHLSSSKRRSEASEEKSETKGQEAREMKLSAAHRRHHLARKHHHAVTAHKAVGTKTTVPVKG